MEQQSTERNQTTKKTEGGGKQKSTIVDCDIGANRQVFLRKKTIQEKLAEKKLDYVKNGVCDSFIKFNTPKIEEVVEKIEKNDEKKIKRLTRLVKLIKEKGEIYDEKISYYQRYIRNGGNLEYHVTEGIKEWFYVNKTNYLKHLKNCKDEDVAQAKALNEYIKYNGSDRYTRMIRDTEIVLNLY